MAVLTSVGFLKNRHLDMNEKRKKYVFGGLLASLAMVFGLIGLSSAEAFGVRGETTVKCCVGMYFGTASGAGTAISNDDSSFYAISQPPDESFSISSLTSTNAYKGSSSGYALRLSTSSAAANMTFAFNAAYSITNVKITAWAWSGTENGKATFALTGNGSSVSFTASESTAPTLSDTEDAGEGYMTYMAVTGSTVSTGFTLSGFSDNRCYISKIVFTINGTSSVSSSVSSSGYDTGTYELVTKSSDIQPGGVYVIGDGKAAGPVGFLGTAISNSYYLSSVTGAVNGDLTMTPTSSMATLILGGESGAWTLTLSNDADRLFCNSQYPMDLLCGSGGSAMTWAISLADSGYGVSLQNVATSYYVRHDAFYWDCSSSPQTVYLYVQTGSVGQTLTSSLTATNVTAGDVNSSITLTASGFTSEPTYEATADDASICSAYVDGTTLYITGLASGSTNLTVLATNGEETASVQITVTVASAEGAFVTLDRSTLSLVATKTPGSVTASSHNIAGTVSYSAVSDSTSVATASVNSVTGVVTITPLAEGTAIVTVVGSNGEVSAHATCAVTVAAAPVPTVSLSAGDKTISRGGAGTITATATGFDDDDSVVFTAVSSNTAVCAAATTNNVITLTGTAVGSATVTVTGTYSAASQTAAATCDVTVLEYSGTSTQYDTYRVNAVKSSGGSATVYDVEWDSSLARYVATAYKTLDDSTDYIEQADVAAYFEAFGTYPQNYRDGKTGALSYGLSGRAWFSYVMGSHDGYDDNYAYGIPGRVVDGNDLSGGSYYELDIGTPSTNPSYNNGSSINRGTYRVVAALGSSTIQEAYADSDWSSGYAPVCVYTTDHYDSFQEYYNYAGAFGSSYAAAGTASFQGAVPTTVTYQVSE
ncbi:MAG: pilus assembly protein N-terminal domain-containing protein [Bacilli bacterium]|jgi:hypothetical protein|nr:pilus assembly protein N-terminal domain-containing protein [Bacilli bacterium]